MANASSGLDPTDGCADDYRRLCRYHRWDCGLRCGVERLGLDGGAVGVTGSTGEARSVPDRPLGAQCQLRCWIRRWAIGILFGIKMIFSGWSLIYIGRNAKAITDAVKAEM